MRHEDIWRILSLICYKQDIPFTSTKLSELTRYTNTIKLPDHLAVNLRHVTRQKSLWKGHHFLLFNFRSGCVRHPCGHNLLPKYTTNQQMHFNIYRCILFTCSHQNVSASIPDIFRVVILLQEYKTYKCG